MPISSWKTILVIAISLFPARCFSQIDAEFNKQQKEFENNQNQCLKHYNGAQFRHGMQVSRYLIDHGRKIFIVEYQEHLLPCRIRYTGMILDRESNGKMYKIGSWKNAADRTDGKNCIYVLYLFSRKNGSVIREIAGFPRDNINGSNYYLDEWWHVCP